MRVRPWQCAVGVAGLVFLGFGTPGARAQSVEELKQRIQQLEQSTRQQIESLKRMIEQQEAQRAQERGTQEERERVLRAVQEQVERQQVSLQKQEERVAKVFEGWENFFDLQAGAKQSQSGPVLGKDVQGNVYSGDQFKIRLGGSLRLHVQRNDTPVGESVSSALLPDKTVAGGGNNAGRENFRAFLSQTRFNLAIQGPETLGGKTQGFFEFDFDQNLSGREGGAVNPNPRLRHAFGRWRFDDLTVKGDELVLTLGQTDAFSDITPDVLDKNSMKAGLGAANRRNPRGELVHRYPVTSNTKFLTSIGLERPFFGDEATGVISDFGPGDLSGFPALSGGIGLETGRIGGDFGIGSSRMYVRTTWGEFEDRLTSTGTSNQSATTDFHDRHFTNLMAVGTFDLDRIGFNKTGRTGTFRLKGGGLWTRGEARHVNAEFDRRVIREVDGSLTEAESVGAFVNPMFFLTDTVSLRWAGGAQYALDSDRPVVTGNLTSNFYRVNNRQSEISLWWTPGPFSFALSYNHTATDWRSRAAFPAVRGSESRENENNKIEFISWFSF